MLAKTESASFVIADISGYTSFLAGVELDHAHDIIADVMDTVVRRLRPPFRLAKFEGDAAFFYAPNDKEQYAIWSDYKLTQPSPEGFTIQKRTNAQSSWVFAGAGRKASGLAYVGDVSGGLAISIKDFWQSYPTGLEVRGDLLIRQVRGFWRDSTLINGRSITHAQRISSH